MSQGNGIADLSGFDVRPKSQEGVEMRLIDPTGKATNVIIGVRGIDSQAYADKAREHVRKRRDRGPVKVAEAERNAEWWEQQAMLVAWWKPDKIVFERGGNPIECTPANVAKVLEDHNWIYEQVLRVASERANFLPGSATAS